MRPVAGAVVVGGALAGLHAWRTFRGIAPELRARRLLVSRSIRGPRTLAVLRALKVPTEVRQGIEAAALDVPGPDGPVPVVRYQRPDRVRPSGALLWLHGGGLVAGAAVGDNAYASRLADELGTLIVSVDYRLAPEHPFPAGLEDAYAVLRWLSDDAAALGVDPTRIAVGGASAGGGLAAALCQLARDRGGPRPCFQLLRYPMLDDRTGRRLRLRLSRHLWSPASNRYGWACYLGRRRYGAHAPPPYASAARTRDLRDLPPAWIGVGSADLFLAESRAYAARLAAAEVPVALDVEMGMYHGADGDQEVPSMQRFRDREIAALRAAVGQRR